MSGQMGSPNENVAELSCDTVFKAIWVVEFDGDTHFQIWPEERPMPGQIESSYAQFSKSKFAFENKYLAQFCLRIPKIAFL